MCLTVSPAVELSLQPQDGFLQSLVLLLLLLELLLPLLRRQLQVDGGGVPDGLGTVTEENIDSLLKNLNNNVLNKNCTESFARNSSVCGICLVWILGHAQYEPSASFREVNIISLGPTTSAMFAF